MKILLKINLYTLLLICLTLHCRAQYRTNAEEGFSKVALKEDLDYLQDYLIKAHPGLFWYTTETEFERSIQKARNSLKANMNENDFLKVAAQLNEVIQCAHTDIRPSNHYNKWWTDSAFLLPFNIIKLESGYYIYQNLSGSDHLKLGTKLLAISGIPIEEIVQALLPYIPADGRNMSRKYNALQRGFYRYYSYFIDDQSQYFDLQLEPLDSEHLSIKIEGIHKALFDERRRAAKSEPQAPISFELIDSLSAAILSVPTFRDDLFQQDSIVFNEYINRCFLELKEKKTENLIIDLRGNGGGYSEYAAELYSYLTDTAYVYCQEQILTTDKLLAGINYDIPETFMGFPDGIIQENGVYKWPNHTVLGWRDSNPLHFDGRVYFLIDGGGASSTSEFTAIAKSHKRGIFIGQEVGGSSVGDSGGVLGWIELPNLKLKIKIAMVQYKMAVKDPRVFHGVRPDITTNYTVQDLIDKNDLDLEAALENILKKD